MTGAAIGSPELAEAVETRERILRSFLTEEAERIARACHAMARAFSRGGILVPYGTGPAATDAAHATVEFMHPIIVGKRALPALAPTNDITGAARSAAATAGADIALGLSHRADDPAVSRLMAQASRGGALTILMRASGDRPGGESFDYELVVPSSDPAIAQEVQETTYHVLWELVHVFFEHPGLLDDACITCGDVAVEARVVALRNGTATVEKGGLREDVAAELLDELEVGDVVLCHAGVALEKLPGEPRAGEAPGDSTGFLYPFLDSGESDLESVLEDVRASTAQKGEDVIALRRTIDLDGIRTCGVDVRARLERGGRVLTFGNGGSATDAQDAAGDFLARGWPAASLTSDSATLTAVGNDVGYDKVFSRQLIPLARSQDVALAITTSGNSANVLAALEEANRRGALTCAIAGYDGGRLRELEWLDHLFVVPSDYIPRIQEAQATIYHLLLEVVGARG